MRPDVDQIRSKISKGTFTGKALQCEPKITFLGLFVVDNTAKNSKITIFAYARPEADQIRSQIIRKHTYKSSASIFGQHQVSRSPRCGKTAKNINNDGKWPRSVSNIKETHTHTSKSQALSLEPNIESLGLFLLEITSKVKQWLFSCLCDRERPNSTENVKRHIYKSRAFIWPFRSQLLAFKNKWAHTDILTDGHSKSIGPQPIGWRLKSKEVDQLN